MLSKIGKVVLLWKLLVVNFCDSKTLPRIVGGETSPINYPYQLSMQKPFDSSGTPKHFCGAVIIKAHFFLTAAHCVKNADTSQMSVLAGTTSLKNEANGVRRNISSCLVHPDFVMLKTSDIALCKVTIPWVFNNSTIDKVKIDGATVEQDVDCTLSGWGSVSAINNLIIPFLNDLIYPNELQHTNFLTMSNDQCAAKGIRIDGSQLCTQSNFRHGACTG